MKLGQTSGFGGGGGGGGDIRENRQIKGAPGRTGVQHPGQAKTHKTTVRKLISLI
jgi:hypothetical protein